MKQVNLRIYRKILPLLLGMFLSVNAFAQIITVKGHVKDSAGEGIIGANIVEKGTTNGTITDFDGNFQLSCKKGVALVISFVGYQSQTVAATQNMVVTLQDDSKMLDNVVVIGYGTVKKSDATGSVVSVKADQLNKGSISNPADMLQGKSAGVQVVSGGGAPGDGATIRVRGGSSLSASNDPLIVIDGLPVSNTSISGMSSPLSTINPNDIETFTVLKDASATAIYGSRASNGVIVITTKKGANGQKKPSISLDMSGTVSYVGKTVDVMDADQLRSYLTEKIGKDDAINALGTSNTDWQKEIYRTAFTEEVNASITGSVAGKGTMSSLPYRISLGHLNQDGVLETSNMKRSTASFNLSPSFFDNHLTVNLNAKGVYAKNRFADTGAIGAAVSYDPTQSIYDTTSAGLDGYRIWRNAAGDVNTMATQNPVAMLEQKDDKSTVKRFVGNAQFDYKFFYVPGLRANLNLGLDISSSDGTVDTPAGCEMTWHDKTQNGSGLHKDYSQTRRDQSLEFYLNYVRECKEIASKFDLMAGYSWQHFYNSTNNLSVKQNDRTSVLEDSPYKTESYLVSFFGRFNYTLLDRYLFTFTARDDGTSRFQNNKWGFFPSAALAWRITEEPWMKNIAGNTLSNLKLRLGYGVTGQQELNAGDYPSIPTYKTNLMGSYYMFGNTVIVPISPKAYAADLKWESTTTYNVGLDFGFLNNRISGSIDAYFRKTKDLINYVPIPAGTNLSNYITMNVGDLENKGIEFALDVVPVQTKDWNWTVGFNVSYNKNKITRLTASDDPSYKGVETGGISGGTGNKIQLHQVGYPTSSFYVYQQIYDVDGKPIEGAYVDRNGDGIVNDNDRYIYKKPAPDVFMGLNTSLSYKKWTLSASARASLGNYIYDNVSSNYEMQADMWTNNFVANRVSSAVKSNFSQAQYQSDYYIHNASFLKLDKVTLAYQIAKWVGVHATAQNILTISDYKGIDPEVSSGIDNNLYPRPISFMLGANFNF